MTDGRQDVRPTTVHIEMLNCTVDCSARTTSIVINSLLPDGKEGLYHRCKQSELFYEKVDRLDSEWYSELYLKSSLRMTNESCLEADWVISRALTIDANGSIRRATGRIFVIQF